MRYLMMLLLVGCSAPPPIVGDGENDLSQYQEDAGSANHCSGDIAVEGCPCNVDAGAQFCGTVYRYSGSYISCEPGYSQCINGVFGKCIGPSVYQGD